MTPCKTDPLASLAASELTCGPCVSCTPLLCLMHPSASMQGNGFKYGVVSLWLLLLGLMSMGARAYSRRGCVLQRRHGPRRQDTAHTEDTQVYKIRQMKEYCYSNDLAKYLASRQLSKPLRDMATELWLPLYLASKGTFCSSADRQWIPPLMLCSQPLPLNYRPFNPSGLRIVCLTPSSAVMNKQRDMAAPWQALEMLSEHAQHSLARLSSL